MWGAMSPRGSGGGRRPLGEAAAREPLHGAVGVASTMTGCFIL